MPHAPPLGDAKYGFVAPFLHYKASVSNRRGTIFVSPELCSERDYVITHSVCSMYVVCMYVV